MRRPTLEASLKGRQATTNHARVVEQLGRDIVSGRFESGSLLPGDIDLAQRFRVSRTVLREALKTLDAKGLINPRVRVGTSIRPRSEWNHFDSEVLLWYIETGVDQRLLDQLEQIRLAFEPAAAALAARNATAAEVEAIGEGAAALTAGNHAPEDAIALMLGIHTRVAAASANVFVQSSEALLKAALIGHFRYDLSFVERIRQRAGEAYSALAVAIRDRNDTAAAEAMQTIVRAASLAS